MGKRPGVAAPEAEVELEDVVAQLLYDHELEHVKRRRGPIDPAEVAKEMRRLQAEEDES